MSELKYVWGILKQNPEDKDMIQAFERVATPEAVKKLLMENERLEERNKELEKEIDQLNYVLRSVTHEES